MNNTDNLLIAARYAKSLIELSKNNELNNLQVHDNLENIKAILEGSGELYSALINPVISAGDKEEVIQAVFVNDTDEILRNFLKLLVKKNRFNLIFDIIKIYNNMLDKLNNVSKVEVTSAIELSEEYREQIKNKLQEILNKEIIINYKTNDSIIAGLIFKMGDNIFDTSISGKLNKFKKAIMK